MMFSLSKTCSVAGYYAMSFFRDADPYRGQVLLVTSLDEVRNKSSTSVDTVILDRLLNRTLDYEYLMAEAYRILKPGGQLLATVVALAPSCDEQGEEQYWGFTQDAARFLTEKYFAREAITLTVYGNVLAGRFLLKRRPAAELSHKELSFTDERWPVVTGIKAIKGANV